MAASTDSPSSTTRSLPSIHEMFPDHLLPKAESPRPRSHRGYTYPHSPGVHHTANHRDRVQEPQCTCTHTSCPRHAHDSRIMSQSQTDSPSLSSKRRPSSSSTSPCQNIYAFNVLRSCPSSTPLTHTTPSSTGANRQSGSSSAFRVDILPSPSSPISSSRNEYPEYRQYQDGRDGMTYASSSDEYASHSGSDLQQTRGSVEGDPRTASNSFPLSRSGPPLPPSPPKHHQHPQRRSSASGSGIRSAGGGYSSHGSFHVNEGLGNNDDDDDGNSCAEDNDTTNGKKHVCPTCLKRFNRPSSLRIHVNTHTGATPFRCPWPNCGREFNVNSNMRRHYRNHATPGFSRSQNATNNPAPTNTSSTATTTNNSPTDGRRKRRRVNIPASQIPPPVNGNGAMTSGSHPHPHPYQPVHAAYRSEFEYRHPPSNPHAARPPHFSSQPHQYPARSSHGYPQGLHPGSNLPQMHMQIHMPSPPISNISISEEDDYSSGSESDTSDVKYSSRAVHLRADSYANVNMRKVDDENDEMLEYDERERLTQSLARVAVAPSSHRSPLYSPYPSNSHEPSHRDHPRHSHSSSTLAGHPDTRYDLYRGSKAERAYTHTREYEARYGNSTNSNTHSHSYPQRPLTPGSSFHSSSPSPSVSPSPLPSPPPSSQQSNYKYSASTPYHRSLADSRVSTTLRPAFARSNEREKERV